MLFVDGADAVNEGMDDAFRHLVDAAQGSDVKVIAVTSVDSKQVVRDTLTERFGADVTEYAVAPLTDTEIDEIVKTFTELSNLNANPRSRELLHRLVVVDLLVRGRVCGVPHGDRHGKAKLPEHSRSVSRPFMLLSIPPAQGRSSGCIIG